MGRIVLILWAKACGIFYCLHEEAIILAGEHLRTHQAGGQVDESIQSAVASLGFLEILDMRPATKSKISG